MTWSSGLIGTGTAFAGAYLQGSLPAVVAVLVLTILAIFIVGVARGFLRPLVTLAKAPP